jgi:NAD(P)-dependent dehydrogenase (short-subunit alcohol dehydrogenase family)
MTSTKRALVTGAAKRIGRAIALELAGAGWDIIVHYHSSQDDAAALAREIEALGQTAALAEIDLADAGLLARLIPMLTADLGPLSALINNASLFAMSLENVITPSMPKRRVF